MGKAIIIPGVNWSANNLGTVSPRAGFSISGDTLVRPQGTFSAFYDGSAVIASWALSDTSVASLSSASGSSVTVTALSTGNVTLTATYDNNTASLSLTVDNVTIITEDDFTSDMLRYSANSSGLSRTCIPITIQHSNSFSGTISGSSSSIKIGVQFWDADHTAPSTTQSDLPRFTGANTTWDSGWITQGQSMSFDHTDNKDTSHGSASSTEAPVTVAVLATYVDGGAGMPTLSEIQSACEFYFEP